MKLRHYCSYLVTAIGLALSITWPSALLAQSDAQWTTLLEGEEFSALQPLGNANWRAEDGAVVADHTEGGAGFLMTADRYQDFHAVVEFWTSDDANSGVFIRCPSADVSPNASTCYEVNIFDQRGDPTYGTGGVVNFAEVDPMPKAGGRWNTMEIIAQGRQIRVIFNGEETANFRNGLFSEGYIGLQYGQGVLKFRRFDIKPL